MQQEKWISRQTRDAFLRHLFLFSVFVAFLVMGGAFLLNWYSWEQSKQVEGRARQDRMQAIGAMTLEREGALRKIINNEDEAVFWRQRASDRLVSLLVSKGTTSEEGLDQNEILQRIAGNADQPTLVRGEAMRRLVAISEKKNKSRKQNGPELEAQDLREN